MAEHPPDGMRTIMPLLRSSDHKRRASIVRTAIVDRLGDTAVQVLEEVYVVIGLCSCMPGISPEEGQDTHCDVDPVLREAPG